ncbi:hypothetical protein KKE06_03270 [Candidatus Micrarchaeota archaeon]|nr:hypothetical protein [Candidatus Micrarchaeota archaeon]
MVFGFGGGKIEIKTEKLNYAPGETISGTVFLKVNKPKKAKRVYIEFYGEQTQTQRGLRMGGKTSFSSKSQTKKIFSLLTYLDGEKEYLGEKEYSFQIKLPSELVPQKPEGALGEVVSAAQFLGGIPSQPKWYLKANLDISGGLDISKRIQLNVG